MALLAECFLYVFQEVGPVYIIGVHFVDNDNPGFSGIGRGGKEFSCVYLNTCRSADHDKGGFGGGYRLKCGTYKTGITGSIYKVYQFTIMVGVQDGRVDRMLPLLFFLIKIADGRLGFDRSKTIDSTASVQNCLRDGGFAAASVTEQDNISNIIDI